MTAFLYTAFLSSIIFPAFFLVLEGTDTMLSPSFLTIIILSIAMLVIATPLIPEALVLTTEKKDYKLPKTKIFKVLAASLMGGLLTMVVSPIFTIALLPATLLFLLAIYCLLNMLRVLGVAKREIPILITFFLLFFIPNFAALYNFSNNDNFLSAWLEGISLVVKGIF